MRQATEDLMSGFVREVIVTRLARGGHAVTFAGRALREE